MFDNLEKSKNGSGESNDSPSSQAGSNNLTFRQGAGSSPGLARQNTGVEDIFSKTERATSEEAAKPDVFKPKGERESVPAMTGVEAGLIKEDNKKKIIVITVIIIALVLFLWFGFWLLAKISQKNGNESLNSEISPGIGQEEGDKINETGAPSSAGEATLKENSITALDSDQDGLSDEEEIELGTDVNNVDSDDDSLFDREEVKVYKTNPLNADTDGDGLLDGEEVKAGSNPAGSGNLFNIPGQEENSPKVNQILDTDKDGLSDSEEAVAKTSINKADTDGDGLNDYDEVMVYKSNPLNSDTDSDGYSDGLEVNSGYNPNGPGKLN